MKEIFITNFIKNELIEIHIVSEIIGITVEEIIKSNLFEKIYI